MRLGGNRDIAAGQAFDIDLMEAPFGLDQPLLAYNELTCDPVHFLGLLFGARSIRAPCLKRTPKGAMHGELLLLAPTQCAHAIASPFL